MAYKYGATQQVSAPLVSAEADAIRTREQILGDINKVQRQIRALNAKLANCREDQQRVSRQLADERAAVNDTRRLVRDAQAHTKAEIKRASTEAAAIIKAGEDEAARILRKAEADRARITETAFQQARAIQDDAHRAGLKRGREYAIARKRALRIA